jgi:hypothetical protein
MVSWFTANLPARAIAVEACRGPDVPGRMLEPDVPHPDS